MLLSMFAICAIAASCFTFFFAETVSLLWLPLFAIAYFAACVALWALFVIVLSYTVDQSKPAGPNQRLWRRLIVETLRMAFPLLHVKISVTGMEKLPTGCNFLFTCNHIEIYDPMVALVALREFDMTFISKKENMDKWVVGNLMHAAGMLPIDRENDRAAVRTVVQAAKLLKEGEVSVGLYPEGYCKLDPNLVLLPFRDGSLKVAQKSGVPIVVATVQGSERIMKDLLRKWRTEVKLDILDVIPAEEVTGRTTKQISEQIWKTMYDKLTEGACEV